MSGRQEIRDLYGRILRTLEGTGNRIAAKGDATAWLIMSAKQEI